MLPRSRCQPDGSMQHRDTRPKRQSRNTDTMLLDGVYAATVAGPRERIAG
jgi:hypothetical protein